MPINSGPMHVATSGPAQILVDRLQKIDQRLRRLEAVPPTAMADLIKRVEVIEKRLKQTEHPRMSEEVDDNDNE